MGTKVNCDPQFSFSCTVTPQIQSLLGFAYRCSTAACPGVGLITDAGPHVRVTQKNKWQWYNLELVLTLVSWGGRHEPSHKWVG